MSYRAASRKEEKEDYQQSLTNDDDLIELFCNEDKFQMMYNTYLQDPSSLNRIVWRLRSLLGEVILITQDFLIENKNLQNFVKIGIPQLQLILNNLLALQCTTRSEKVKANEIKRAIQRIYKQEELFSIDDFVNVFNFCVEIWKEPLQFELQVSDPQPNRQIQTFKSPKPVSQNEIYISDEDILDDEDFKAYENDINDDQDYQQQPEPEPKPRRKSKKQEIMIEDSEEPAIRRTEKKKETNKNYQRMEEQAAPRKRGRPRGRKNAVPSKNMGGNPLNLNPKYNDIKRNGAQLQTEDEEMPVQQVYEGIDYSKKNSEKAMNYPPSSAHSMNANKLKNDKWTIEEEKVLCKTYADLGNERQCYRKLTSNFGQSLKWKTKELIVKKIQTLVRRVVDKFKNIATTNPNVLKFKNNELFILNQNYSINPQLKKLIDRTILVIYLALVEMNNDKAGNREILSKKIIEVNELCNKDFKMNKTIA